MALGSQLAHERFLTTNHVLGECWTLIRRKLGHGPSLELVSAVRASERYTIHHVGRDAEDRAFDWLKRHDERVYSFVDATSFETMRELRIEAALAFDADFEAAGFRTLRPSGPAPDADGPR